jgi:hypothetical protein
MKKTKKENHKFDKKKRQFFLKQSAQEAQLAERRLQKQKNILILREYEKEI